MGKSSSTPPPAPDPAATAAAQETANVGSATAQANLDRVNQVTPQGNLTYSTTGTNSDGTPQETATTSLSPAEQQKYDLNNQIATQLDGLAGSNIDRVAQAQSTPFTYDGMTPEVSNVTPGALTTAANAGPIQKSLDYSGLSALPTANDFSSDNANTAQAQYAQAASRLDPQWQNNDSDTKSALAAQGISENSDAYRRAETTESNAKTDAYNQANYSAVAAGNTEQATLQNEALADRQQGQSEVNDQGAFANTAQAQQYQQNSSDAAMQNTNQATEFNEGSSDATLANSSREQEIEQAAYLRNMPLNDIATLLGTGTGVQAPSFTSVPQVGVAAPDYQGLVSSNYTAAMNQYNTQQQSQAQMLGSIFGTAGSAAGAIFSDRRFKENIKRIGTLANGIATYAYNYIGNRAQQFGVMAQEVMEVMPDAVGSVGGRMYVDYGKVYG